MKILINKKLAGHDAGSIVEIVSHGGIPAENFWRRRLRDAAIDGCCQIVKEDGDSGKKVGASKTKEVTE